jgi:hypothetical protein
MSDLIPTDIGAFSAEMWPERVLRGYQRPVAEAVAESVELGRAMEYAAVFSRQAGKDEMLAQLCAYLLLKHHDEGGNIVVALPALRPQGLITRDRLIARLDEPETRGLLRVRDGTTVQVGRASARFLSASPSANSRGNTADLLLVANEAQDIDTDTWDAVFAPMGASTNATTLYMGTVWSSQTLLARQLRLLAELERADAIRRIFRVPWREVERELPAYGDYVRRQMALLGENHPFIRTEYELEELDGGGSLFPPERREPLRGNFSGLLRPDSAGPAGTFYTFTIDVAGEAEDGVEGELARRANPRRDSTALSVFRVISGRRLPVYQLVARYSWTGARQTDLHDRIVRLARLWDVRKIVIDATGMGAGLASFLRATLGERVVAPFVFSSVSKSQLAWGLLGMIDADRVSVFTPDAGSDGDQIRLDALFWRQLAACRFTVMPGPGKLLRWSVEDLTLHDDLLISFALVAALDHHDLRHREARGR